MGEIDDCQYCGSGRVVPVLDARMINQATGGNPYRVRCLGCYRWLPSTSKETFKNHLHPYVLPKDADPDNDEAQIRLEEWDRAERYQDVLDRLEAYRDRDRPYSTVDEEPATPDEVDEIEDGQAVATDGGVDEPANDDEPSEEVSNTFDCPKCEDAVEGYPDVCPHCGANYEW